jgi:hypothetical protein
LKPLQICVQAMCIAKELEKMPHSKASFLDIYRKAVTINGKFSTVPGCLLHSEACEIYVGIRRLNRVYCLFNDAVSSSIYMELNRKVNE